MTKGIIFDVKRFALHDGPGTRTTLFLKGCPLNCQWCHNPEGISPQPKLIYHQNRCIVCGDCVAACSQNAIKLGESGVIRLSGCNLCGDCAAVCTTGAWAISGRTVIASEIIAEIEKDFLFFDTSNGGLTFSGGEPLAQTDFLEALLIEARQRGFHTAVDTSGYTPVQNLQRINAYTDLFLFDIKCIDETKHRAFTGVSNRVILENFCVLAEIAQNIIVRIPVIPGFNADMDDISAIGDFVKSRSNVTEIDLLPYHAMAREKYTRLNIEYPHAELTQIDPGIIESFRHILEEKGFKVRIGG